MGQIYARGIGGEADVLGWESGCFLRDTTDKRSDYNVTGSGHYVNAYAYKFDASRSSTIYGSSTTVIPSSLGVVFYIRY